MCTGGRGESVVSESIIQIVFVIASVVYQKGVICIICIYSSLSPNRVLNPLLRLVHKLKFSIERISNKQA